MSTAHLYRMSTTQTAGMAVRPTKLEKDAPMKNDDDVGEPGKQGQKASKKKAVAAGGTSPAVIEVLIPTPFCMCMRFRIMHTYDMTEFNCADFGPPLEGERRKTEEGQVPFSKWHRHW